MTNTQTLRRMSDDALLSSLCRAAANTREATAELLSHIAEADARRLYLGSACSSMFAYLTERLGFDEGAAYKRIAVARLARRFPVVLEAVADGALHLAGAALLAPHLTVDNHRELLAAASGRSKRQIATLLADRNPSPDAPAKSSRVPERPDGAGVAARELTLTWTPARPADAAPLDRSDPAGSVRARAGAAAEANALAPAPSSPGATASAVAPAPSPPAGPAVRSAERAPSASPPPPTHVGPEGAAPADDPGPAAGTCDPAAPPALPHSAERLAAAGEGMAQAGAGWQLPRAARRAGRHQASSSSSSARTRPSRGSARRRSGRRGPPSSPRPVASAPGPSAVLAASPAADSPASTSPPGPTPLSLPAPSTQASPVSPPSATPASALPPSSPPPGSVAPSLSLSMPSLATSPASGFTSPLSPSQSPPTATQPSGATHACMAAPSAPKLSPSESGQAKAGTSPSPQPDAAPTGADTVTSTSWGQALWPSATTITLTTAPGPPSRSSAGRSSADQLPGPSRWSQPCPPRALRRAPSIRRVPPPAMDS